MSDDIPGRYIHKKSRSNYIELKPDGTCVLFERGTAISATYEVNGMEIKIFGAESSSQGTIRNGVIVDAEGEKWLRPDATDDPLATMTWVPAILRRYDFPWELIDIAVILFIFILLLVAR